MSQISIQGPAKISFFIEACVGLFVLRKVKCADPYIFYTGVHTCSREHVFRTVWVSPHGIATDKNLMINYEPPSRGWLFQKTVVTSSSKGAESFIFSPRRSKNIFSFFTIPSNFLRLTTQSAREYRRACRVFSCCWKVECADPYIFYTVFTRVPACIHTFRTVWVSPHGIATDKTRF